MKRAILTVILLLFLGAVFCSYLMVTNKIKKGDKTFTYTAKEKIADSLVAKVLPERSLIKDYWWEYKIKKTYHSNGMSIYASLDTLSKEIHSKDK